MEGHVIEVGTEPELMGSLWRIFSKEIPRSGLCFEAKMTQYSMENLLERVRLDAGKP